MSSPFAASCFCSESARQGPSITGVAKTRWNNLLSEPCPSDERQVQRTRRTHLILLGTSRTDCFAFTTRSALRSDSECSPIVIASCAAAHDRRRPARGPTASGCCRPMMRMHRNNERARGRATKSAARSPFVHPATTPPHDHVHMGAICHRRAPGFQPGGDAVSAAPSMTWAVVVIGLMHSHHLVPAALISASVRYDHCAWIDTWIVGVSAGP